jgi:hypothetical protein
MGSITIRLDPALIRQVGFTMAGPAAAPEPWQALAIHPHVVELEQPSNPVRFERLYRLMLFIQGLLLRQGGVTVMGWRARPKASGSGVIDFLTSQAHPGWMIVGA